jgi:hypothetical protein
MDTFPWLIAPLSRLTGLWQALDGETQLAIWLAAGAVGLLLWAWASYRLLRRLAGHHRFRGRWFNGAEYQRLMQVLWEDQQQGTRVMSHAELRALRAYRYGKSVKPLLAGKGGGYFDG